MGRFDELRAFLLNESKKCLRPAVGRFAHDWIAPMPLSEHGRAYLRARGVKPAGEGASAASATSEGDIAAQRAQSDVFSTGDYSLGMFHHDASEASIELLRHKEFVAACRGTLMNFLDTMRPDGRIQRVELTHKSHEHEPSKPVMAQFALRCVTAAETFSDAEAWLKQTRIYERLSMFMSYLEKNYTGMHGLFLAHSALQTGFDNDLLTVGWPDMTIEDPGISAMMVLEYDAMARLGARLGHTAESTSWTEKANRLRKTMNETMWFEDASGAGYYAALKWRHGTARLLDEFVTDGGGDEPPRPLCTWVSLLPLYAGVADESRAEKALKLLLDESKFWGPSGVRTVAADSPYFTQSPRCIIYDQRGGSRGPVSNWAGPVWVLSNYYMAEALARYGKKDKARELATKTAEVLLRDLKETGSLHECYDDVGKGLWPQSGGFVSWNVLAITMLDRFGE